MRPLRRVLPLPRVKLRVSRWERAGGDPENGMECGHRIEPTIEAKHVLIEVGLQMFWLDAPMVGSLDPCLQVAEDEMDHRQVRLCLVWIATERHCYMAVAHLGQSWVAGPPVGAYGSAKRDVLFDKAGKHFSAPIGYDAKPQTSCVYAALVRLTVILTRPNLDGTNYGRLVMRATAFPARLAANIALIDFDHMLAADGIAFGTNHASAELMEYLKGRLIASESELTLKLDGGLSGGLRSHEVRAPKPRRKWRMARLHDCASRKRCIRLASPTAQHNRRAGWEAVGFVKEPAFWTHKPAWPTKGLKIAGASYVIGKYPLKLWEGSRKAACVHIYKNSKS